MQEAKNTRSPCEERYKERFVKFLRLFASIGGTEKLFPKECRSCKRRYETYAEYVCATRPKGHVLQDCKQVMRKAFTMVYRHCDCGNTLVVTLTDETFPELDDLWTMLAEEAQESGKPLTEVVEEFAEQSDRYILRRENPCIGWQRR